MNSRVAGWIVGALVVLVAGCGGGGETKTVTVEATPGAGDEASGTPEASATPGADGEAPAIVQSKGSMDGKRVQFVLTELRRSGPTVILNARLENSDAGTDAQVGETFDDGTYQQLEDGEAQEESDVFDGVAMVDPEGRKKYLVARDETGRCVCTNGLSDEFAEEGAPVQLTATLTAPPAEITQVDLLIPHFETLRDVPLSE